MELNNIFEKYINPVKHDSSKVDSEYCKNCGGKCCHAMGCHISPFDFKEITFQSIVNFIDETECISIDWWNGNPITNDESEEKAFFLRIKNKDSKVIDPSYGGTCCILTDTGCPLSFEYRPKGARELIPHESECVIKYSKQQCAIDWYPYQDILQQVHDYYYEKGEMTESNISAVDCLLSLFGIPYE